MSGRPAVLLLLLLGGLAHAEDRPAVRVDRQGDPLPEGALARLGTTRLRVGDRDFSVAVSPDGKVLAGGSASGSIHLWDASGRRLHTLQAHSSAVHSLAFSPDGKLLASGGGLGRRWRIVGEPPPAGSDFSVRVWDTTTLR